MSSGRAGRGLRAAVITIAAAAAAVSAFFIILRFSPYGDWDDFMRRPYSPVLTDRDGEVLRVVPLAGGLRRIWAPLEAYPPYLIDAFLAAEDERFYSHPGIDPVSVVRAAVQNRRAGRVVSGASTVSMQLAGLAGGYRSTMAGKLAEAAGALRLEAGYSKDELLEIWLSSLPFGHNIEGVCAASRHFFGREAGELSREQAYLLSVIPRRPAFYDPGLNPEETAAAAFAVSDSAGAGLSLDDLTEAAEACGGIEPLWPFEAPHFSIYAESQLPSSAYNGGRVACSLDLGMNDILQAAVCSKVSSAERFRISNGAGVIIDTGTGEILAYLGSADFFDSAASGQIDGVRMLRQPGSTLKPFLYAMALERGFTAASILPDIPMSFGNEEIYIPQNYNQRFNGPVRLRTALSSSLNIPAIHLAEKIGVEAFSEKLISLGFDSLIAQRGRLGVGLAVGNAEVSLLELASAYTVFSEGGLISAARCFAAGAGLTEGEKVAGGEAADLSGGYSPETIELIRSILSDNVDRILGFGRRGSGVEGFDAILKTGTSNQFNNIWAVGMTPGYVCAIWMGNFSGETVIGSPGSGIPAAALVDVLSRIEDGSRFSKTAALTPLEICPLSGGRAGDACPGSMIEYFVPGTEPGVCGYHSIENSRILTAYPDEYRRWAEMYELDFRSGGGAAVKAGPAAGGLVRISSPADGSVFFADSGQPGDAQAVSVDIEGSGSVAVYLNGEPAAEGRLPMRWFLPVRRGSYRIRAESDSGSDSILVTVR